MLQSGWGNLGCCDRVTGLPAGGTGFFLFGSAKTFYMEQNSLVRAFGSVKTFQMEQDMSENTFGSI